MKYGLACLCVLLAFPLAVFGQTTKSSNQGELIQILLARIEKLERRLAELESNGNGKPAANEAAPPSVPAAQQSAPAPAPSLPPEQPQQMMAEAPPTYPSLKIAGFSDFGFSATDQPGTKSGFSEGQFALHLSSALSSNVSAFAELSLTARADAGTGAPAAPGFNAEVERVAIRFDHSDALKLSFGRYHTPINWWNTAFHHGWWLQTTISRPEMTQFGGHFIPVHFVGALAEGVFPARGLNLNYNLGLGNGRGSVISRGGDAGENNNHRAWLINAFVKPDRFYGLQAGGSVYRDKITLATGREFREWITAAHFIWQKEDPEVIAEAANVSHREVGRPGTSNSQAYYVQLGYRLPWAEKLWKPYYRFEYIHIPRSDAVLVAVPNLAGHVLGVRYDISSFAALKAEYRNLRRQPGQPRVHATFLQTNFTF